MNNWFLLSRNEAMNKGFQDAAEQSVIDRTNPAVMKYDKNIQYYINKLQK
jgi:hypothetical protein